LYAVPLNLPHIFCLHSSHANRYDNSREEHVRKMWRQLSTERGSGRVLEKNDAGMNIFFCCVQCCLTNT
jgi:hypothetical protein